MKKRQHLFGSLYPPLLSFGLLLVTGGSGGLGCSEATEALDTPPAEALRARFPEQAAAVLAPEEEFVANAQGFSLEAGGASAVPRALELYLPRSGQGVVRLQDRGGFEVRVRELGLTGDGSVADRSVTYRRAGMPSFASGLRGWASMPMTGTTSPMTWLNS